MSTYAKKFLITKHLSGKKKLPKYHLQVSGVISVLKMSFVFLHTSEFETEKQISIFLTIERFFLHCAFLDDLQVSSSQHESDYCSVSRGLQVYALVP